MFLTMSISSGIIDLRCDVLNIPERVDILNNYDYYIDDASNVHSSHILLRIMLSIMESL